MFAIRRPCNALLFTRWVESKLFRGVSKGGRSGRTVKTGVARRCSVRERAGGSQECDKPGACTQTEQVDGAHCRREDGSVERFNSDGPGGPSRGVKERVSISHM